MSTRWRIVDLVNYSGHVGVKRGNLVVKDSEVPLADVACIVTGDKTSWDAGFVSLTAQYEVPVVVCDWRNVPIATLTGWSSNSRVGARHQAQASLSIPREKNAWMRIVKEKINGQANNLNLFSSETSRLKQLATEVRSGDPANIEALAARIYWAHVFHPDDFQRDRNGKDRNPLLNYGYTILRGAVIRGVVISGLAPALGLWHRNRANAFALADDLIEPFRPAIDHVVKSMEQTTNLRDPGVRQALVQTLTMPMSQTGETVNSAIVSLCQKYACYVEGDSDFLEVPTWSSPHG